MALFFPVLITRDLIAVQNIAKLGNPAVRRMMPGGPLSRRQMKNLYVYAGPEHKHDAQQPTAIDLAALNAKNVRTA